MTRRRSEGPPAEPVALFEIVHTARLVDRAFTRVFTASGLSAGRFGVLAVVNDDPGITQAHVSRVLHARPQSIARAVTDLADEGLIERDRPSRRGSPTGLRITEDGRRALDRAWPGVMSLAAPESLGMSEGDLARLAELLAMVRRALDEPGADRILRTD